ncbi:signal-peptide-less P35 lipoprotein homolog [Malacoplasma penetrans HF-2]|uniref:Signal-peptide-less P35 lipoprotein homolog n=1 Tax=Malacoplasma penetrans (strain HF-2) TaxID=272633 RepID=Q8EV61_MALP2|nr:P35 family lipoprotein [Malacoplasma penetrans]BAC44499.1 signal-peptide-less P35 lipoprotein homolog [Malacoplasma penetrans HF-2]
MKTQRSKIGKVIALSGIFTVTAAVPAAVLSSAALNGNFANNQSGDALIPSNPSGHENTKVTPKLKSSIQMMGSEDLFDLGSNKTTNELLAQKIKDNPSLFFENPEVLAGKNFDVVVEDNLSSSAWTGQSYDVSKGNWGNTIEESNKLLYSSSSPNFTISSLDDFKAKLNAGSRLKDSLTAAGLNVDSNTTPSIKNKIGLSDGLFHINVEASVSNKKADYDLQIPTSNINFSFENLNIKVTGNDVVETKQRVAFKYSIGIKSISKYNGSSEIMKMWYASESAVMSGLGFLSSSKNESSELILDNNKVSKALGVFNTTFSNTKLELDNSAVNEGNYLTFKVTITGNANADYCFEDGTTSKEFSFPVKLLQRNAAFYKYSSNITQFQNQTFAWRNSGLPTVSSKEQVEKRIDDFAQGKSDDPSLRALLDEINTTAKNLGILKNASFKFLKFQDSYYTLEHGLRWRVYLSATVDQGFEVASGNPEFTKVQLIQIWIPN